MVKETIVNGLKLKTDLKDSGNLVTVNYLINVGSYNEDKSNLGITHLIEHLLFKGTINRNSEQIMSYIESLGGTLNAYTSFEKTSFYCTVPSEYWKEAIEFLNDLIFYNTIPEKEFKLEKDVVLNELRMYADDPENVCGENLYKLIFKNNINRQIVGGTVDVVKNITRQQVLDFIDSNYINENIDIIITGHIDSTYNDLYNYISDIVPELSNKSFSKIDEVDFNEDEIEINKIWPNNINQSQLCCGIIGPNKLNDDYIPFKIIINALGGNMSSILFKEVREKLGLVYSIGFEIQDFSEYCLAIGSTSSNKENIELIKNIINKEIKKLKINNEMLENNKRYLIGILLLKVETTNGYNSYLSSNKIDINDYIDKIKKVNIDDIERVIKKYFNKIYYSSLMSK